MPGLPLGSRRAALLVVLAAALAYARVLGGGFQYDDFHVIVDDPGVHSLSAWAAGLGGLRPLLKLSYALNWLAGPAPAGFLAVNLALHLGNAWMVHRLLLGVGAWTGLEDRRAAFAAFAGALLFALHPVQSEAVAYISGRSSSLSAALVLGSVLAYLRGRAADRLAWTNLLSPGLFVLAVLAKETALALPLALTLLEACGRTGRRRPFAGPGVHWSLAGAAVLALVLHPGYHRFLAGSLGLRGWAEQLRGSVEGCAYLFGKLLRPVGLNLDPPLVIPPAWDSRLAGWGLLLAGLALAGPWALRRRPWLVFGLLWGLLWLLPTQGPVPRLDLANERHLYLSLAGFGFAMGLGLAGLPARAGGALLGAAALALAVPTFRRVLDYRDEVTMWRSSLAVAPANPRAWNNLGVALHGRGDGEGATRAFSEALRLRPRYRQAEENLRAVRPGRPGVD